MKITKIEVKNYRLLKDFSIDLEKELSLVVGKNNCGKTSLLSALKKFLNSPSALTFDDFNLDLSEELQKIITEDFPEEQKYSPKGITLKLFIEYFKEDNLANISQLMMDLDSDNNQIILAFEYSLSFDNLRKLKMDYEKSIQTDSRSTEGNEETTNKLNLFLKGNHQKYFKLYQKALDLKDETKFIDLEKEKISLKNIINYKFIQANREVSNKDSEKSLSTLASAIYEKIEGDEEQLTNIDDLKSELQSTDNALNESYSKIFASVIEKVKKFGGIKPEDTAISITSTLQHKEILKGNTTVLYSHGEHKLPENYNGLGYMNLINMIFEIEIKANEFKREKEFGPADINLLFIEEPEAHTHPQMQYIFIRNIKELLKNAIDSSHPLQYIVSTHSSHIVSESEFEDIKYLKRAIGKNSVDAKNLKDLEGEHQNDDKIKNYKFLKQYLTLHRAELFFADKVIFIEGDTERILLPAMMKKIDQEESENPLLSQNISVVETGAYSHIFEKFISFVGIKSLIITDIDSSTECGNKCKVNDATITTNASLKFFYDTGRLADFKGKNLREMILKKGVGQNKWIKDENGSLVCVYQSNEKNSHREEYHARSFEDSFFHINREFIINNKANFKSLKNINNFDNPKYKPYDLAEQCIKKKPAFAIEILLNSTVDTKENNFSNWKIPDYIKQGLLWLKKD